jgi:hypothetical protein
MSRNIIRILMAVVVLNAIAVASAMVWPTVANSTAVQANARADFDQVFAHMTVQPDREFTPAALAPADYERIFASITVPWDRPHAPATLTPDFDRVFASVSVRRREDTPPNRERLRNIGWKRILGSH